MAPAFMLGGQHRGSFCRGYGDVPVAGSIDGWGRFGSGVRP